jgi:hypothetical protein
VRQAANFLFTTMKLNATQPNTIWKFELKRRDQIEMPAGAKLLTVQMQNGKPHLWALVDPYAPKEIRHFEATSYDVEGDIVAYVATIQASGGAPVRHVFEVSP